MNNIEEYIEKPEGKPVKNFRARVKMYGNDVVVVNPEESRESNRKMIKQKGKSSFYKSEGEKESSYSIHINVDANDPDPVLQTTIGCSPTIERELLQLQGDMGRVIGANYSEIIKVFNQAAKKKDKGPSYPTDEDIIDRV